MNKTWFTSDTHFSSQRTLELSKRPFNSVEEMDEVIINNWNSVVGEDDEVYHLGDFGNLGWARRLNGTITLIRGNYEDGISDEELMSYGIARVVDMATIYYKNGLELELCHKPSDCRKDKFNLFGHIHKLAMVKRYGLNVGVDCHNFYPIDMEMVEFYRNAIENHYDENVFE